MAGHPVFDIVVTGVTPSEMSEEILGLHPALETPFVGGTVPAAFADRLITLEASRVSKLEFLKALLGQLRKDDGAACEWEATWDGAAYRIDLVEEASWTVAERAAGVADPALRPIEAPTAFYNRRFGQPDSKANRLRMREEASSEGLFTAIVMTAGEEGEVIVGDARWYVTASSSVTVEGEARTVLTLAPLSGGTYGPVYADDALVGLYVANATGTASFLQGHVVRATRQPDEAGVAGSSAAIGPGHIVAFFTQDPSSITVISPRWPYGFEGTTVNVNPAPLRPHAFSLPSAVAAYGRVERVEHFADVAPYRNELTRLGMVPLISADFSQWETLSDLNGTHYWPQGWIPGLHSSDLVSLGQYPTFSEILRSGSEGYLVRYGTSAARVTCSTPGTGAQTRGFTLPHEMDKPPYLSFYLALTVEAGCVRVSLGPSWDKAEPSGEVKAEAGVSGNIVAFEVGNLDMSKFDPEASLSLFITALEPDTVFVPGCGARALHDRRLGARARRLRRGGRNVAPGTRRPYRARASDDGAERGGHHRLSQRGRDRRQAQRARPDASCGARRPVR